MQIKDLGSYQVTMRELEFQALKAFLAVIKPCWNISDISHDRGSKQITFVIYAPVNENLLLQHFLNEVKGLISDKKG